MKIPGKDAGQQLFGWIVVLVAVCVFGLSGCGRTPSSEQPMARRLTIIGTADLQGRLEPASRSVRLVADGKKIPVTGGIARIATQIKEIRQQTSTPLVVVSAGDDLMGRYYHQFEGRAILPLMAASGYQILALGNHEFDRGPGVLAQALETGGLDTLCSDLRVENTVMAGTCHPFLIRRDQGVTIGFFSLMTEQFPHVTVTGDVRLAKNQYQVAREMVSTLRDQGAQVIVAVTHIGADQDRRLAAAVDGIDIIFGGHSHEYLPTLGRVGSTLIVNGGEKGAALVRLDVALDGQGRVVPDSAHYSLIPVSGDIQPDSAVAEKLAAWKKQLPAATVIGRTEKTWDLSKESLRGGESGVADLVTDLIRDRFGVDLVLLNSGALRGNTTYPPGPVTDTMVAAIDEFESDIYLLELQGRVVREILEHSAARIGQGGFLQVSGLRVVIDPSRPAQELGGPADNPRIVRPGQRVSGIKVWMAGKGWQPLEDTRWYRVAANDFLVHRAGDGYYWFGRYGRSVSNTYSTMGSLLTDLFQEKKVVNPKETDGRITLR